MERVRALVWTSRVVAVGAGLVMVFAGWYLLMTAAFGNPPNDENLAAVIVAGIAWTAAGLFSLTAGFIDARNVRPAARLDVLAGIAVLAAAPLVDAPLALIPGTLMVVAAVGERVARRLARATATFAAIHPAGGTPAPSRRAA